VVEGEPAVAINILFGDKAVNVATLSASALQRDSDGRVRGVANGSLIKLNSIMLGELSSDGILSVYGDYLVVTTGE
jgi:hypothetical protein